VQVGVFGSAVVNGDTNQDVRRGVLRVFRNDIEITIFVEGTRIITR